MGCWTWTRKGAAGAAAVPLQHCHCTLRYDTTAVYNNSLPLYSASWLVPVTPALRHSSSVWIAWQATTESVSIVASSMRRVAPVCRCRVSRYSHCSTHRRYRGTTTTSSAQLSSPVTWGYCRLMIGTPGITSASPCINYIETESQANMQ